MQKLVESWIVAEQDLYGNNIAAAVKALNDALGTNATPSRVSEWRRGIYHPSNFLISQMLWRTLPWALKRAGLEASADSIAKVRELLWVFEVQNNRRQRHIL